MPFGANNHHSDSCGILNINLSSHILYFKYKFFFLFTSLHCSIDALNKITHLRLDRENIGAIDNLELLGGGVTNVYLQMVNIIGMTSTEMRKLVSADTVSFSKSKWSSQYTASIIDSAIQ